MSTAKRIYPFTHPPNTTLHTQKRVYPQIFLPRLFTPRHRHHNYTRPLRKRPANPPPPVLLVKLIGLSTLLVWPFVVAHRLTNAMMGPARPEPV